MTIRAGKKTKNEVSIQEPIGVDKEGNELPLTFYRQRWNQCITSLIYLFWKFRM